MTHIVVFVFGWLGWAGCSCTQGKARLGLAVFGIRVGFA
jgi:hypothetical protein